MKTNFIPTDIETEKKRLASAIGISIISDIDDLINLVFVFTERIEKLEFGFDDKRIKELPVVYEIICQWENKNIQTISDRDKNRFYIIKESVERLLEKYKVPSPEVFIKN